MKFIVFDAGYWPLLCPFCQELMSEAEKIPNAVKACNKPRLYEELEDLQKR